jgi:hypothetical protein
MISMQFELPVQVETPTQVQAPAEAASEGLDTEGVRRALSRKG